MNRSRTVLTVLSLFASGSVAMGNLQASSKHNLSRARAGEPVSDQVETCIFCHAPHGAAPGSIPLWNHATTTATFSMYASGTMHQVAEGPSPSSRACLSCHDGTVAVGAMLTGLEGARHREGDRKSLAEWKLTGGANLGTDLSNDHPISIDYEAAQVWDAGLHPSSTALPFGQPVSGTIAALLVSGKVECSSCHLVHDIPDGFEPALPDTMGSFAPMLKISKYGSKLCTTCHIK